MIRPIDLNNVYQKGNLTLEEWTDPNVRAELYHLEYMGRKLRGGWVYGPDKTMKESLDLRPWASLPEELKQDWIRQAEEQIRREAGTPLPDAPSVGYTM